jgi:hypothetical protein
MGNLRAGAIAQINNLLDEAEIVTYWKFRATGVGTRYRHWMPDPLVETTPPPFTSDQQSGAGARLRAHGRLIGGSGALSLGRVRALIALDPLPPPIGSLHASTLDELIDPNRPSPLLNGYQAPRGYTLPIAFRLQGVQLDGLTAYCDFRVTGTTPVVVAKASGSGIFLGTPSAPDDKGIQEVDGWLAIGPNESTSLPDQDVVMLDYQFYLDDGNDRKHLADQGRLAIVKPGALPVRRW